MEVTHCNIIAMAIKSESPVARGAERGGRARMSKGQNGRRDFQQLESDVRLFFSVKHWLYKGAGPLFYIWNAKLLPSACFCHAASSPSFISSPVLLFLHLLQFIFFLPLLPAWSNQPSVLSGVCFSTVTLRWLVPRACLNTLGGALMRCWHKLSLPMRRG